MGAVHVCEHVECKLPAEDWFQAAQQTSANGANTGKLNKPERSKSSPPRIGSDFASLLEADSSIVHGDTVDEEGREG